MYDMVVLDSAEAVSNFALLHECMPSVETA